MLNFLGFGSKVKINEHMLEQHHIKLIHKHEIKIDKSTVLALTGSGKFYKGFYKHDTVSIKIVDITKEDTIINEFIYWQVYKDHDNFLHLIGVALSNSQALLVFDFFRYNLEHALQNNLLSDEARISMAYQALRILELFQKENKKIMDFRPGVLGVTDGKKLKLLDFGIMITIDKLMNSEVIDKQRIKYQPPEYFNFSIDELSYDIWSFGCILIDLFSREYPVYQHNLSTEDIGNLHQVESFPEIPRDINGILKDIILRCLERNWQKRITIEELSDNLRIFLETLTANESELMKVNGKINGNARLNQSSEFVEEIDLSLRHTSILLTDDLMDRTFDLKREVECDHNNAVKNISGNYLKITESISKLVNFKMEALGQLREKISANIQAMEQYFKCAVNDISDGMHVILFLAQGILNDMKISVTSLSKFSNQHMYQNVFESLNKCQEMLVKQVEMYSEKEKFDKIKMIYHENKQLADMYKHLTNNNELLFIDILNAVKCHQEKLFTESNFKHLVRHLNIQSTLLATEDMK